jgi:hypothetical protein
MPGRRARRRNRRCLVHRPGGTFSSDCGPVTLALLDETATGSDCLKTITRTYRATDTCGGQMECSQTITVQDTVAPTISDVPASLSLECDGTPPPVVSPTVRDNCDPSPTIILVELRVPEPLCPNAYTLTRSWFARDACFNDSPPVSQTIKVHDTTPPMASTPAASLDRTVEAGDATALAAAYALQPVFADACEGPVAPSTPVEASIPDGSCATGNAIERRWRATDRCGNVSADFVQRITFVDTTPPTITCPEDILKTTGPDTVVDFVVTAADNADPDPRILTDHPNHSRYPMGTTTVKCKARDRCGNESAECSFTVTVTAVGCVTADERTILRASDAQRGDLLGLSVAIHGDTIVVGAPYENGCPGDAIGGAGAVYVFERNAGGTDHWGEVRKLTASDAQKDDFFGQSVAVSGDTISVGAFGEDGGPGDPTPAAGAVYVFERNAGGTDHWGELRKLTASDAQSGDHFGFCVAVDRDTIVVGARGEDGGPGDPLRFAGAVYVFGRDAGGPGNWGEIAKRTASDARIGDLFGSSVGISGETIVVGVSEWDDAGAAYLFGRDTGGPGHWGEIRKVAASDAEAGDQFGYSVAIEGSTMVVGAPYEGGGSGDPLSESGAAYVFSLVDAPCARDDTFRVPADAPLTLPIGTLLGNDAHSRGRPIYISGHDTATARGAAIGETGSPVTALTFYTPPDGWTQDTFTYRITDGTQEAVGTVHLLPVAFPTAPPNHLGIIPPPTDGGLTLVFTAPAAGTYVLERRPVDLPYPSEANVWTEVARQTTTKAGPLAFLDPLMPSGALYRVRQVP